jgi:tetratricopeptide (TPR) repeat protein
VAEAEARLNGAIAIHAIDGRLGQLAAALATRGRIERAMDRWARGERALLLAVDLQQESGNLRGWASSVQDLAQLYFEAGRYELAFQLVTSVYAQLESGGDASLQPTAGLAACDGFDQTLGEFLGVGSGHFGRHDGPPRRGYGFLSVTSSYGVE